MVGKKYDKKKKKKYGKKVSNDYLAIIRFYNLNT